MLHSRSLFLCNAIQSDKQQSHKGKGKQCAPEFSQLLHLPLMEMWDKCKIILSLNMEFTLNEGKTKHLFYSVAQTWEKYRVWCMTFVIYMSIKQDKIIIACTVNQLDLFNNLHKLHIITKIFKWFMIKALWFWMWRANYIIQWKES